MNKEIKKEKFISVCPHDCPSSCSLEVERIDGNTIGRIYGAKEQTYTKGVICAKVARYAERIHHPDRLTKPLRRKGEKGSWDFEEISWDSALDILAEKMLEAEQHYGSEAIWPYYYAGTMGLVQRDGINRLRHVKKYSGMFATFCTNMSWTGFAAGTGKLAGVDPREMAKSDLIVVWGTNPVNTQVNVMTHVQEARKTRNAKLIVVDVYHNDTMKKADLALCLKPGTDGALACSVMHILFRDAHVDWAYMEQHTDCPHMLKEHLEDKTPEWAADITGLSVNEIELFAKMIGENARTFFRLGYGFTRSRNGAVNMHAALCIPTVTGAWNHEGGGAFHTNGAIYNWDKQMIEGLDCLDTEVRVLDQSLIGRALCGEVAALYDGPPVQVLFIQNTNPANVAPEQKIVKQGLSRPDLFTCVHEQFHTDTTAYADIVLPATMFLEHNDVYQGGGHQHIMYGPKIVEAPGDCRSNHWLICEMAKRLDAVHPGFEMDEDELIDYTLGSSGWGSLQHLKNTGWMDVQPSFETSHYLEGFGHDDRLFHFAVDWQNIQAPKSGLMGPYKDLPQLPDHWDVTEEVDEQHPFRLTTSPSRSFLNSSFAETPSSRAREGKPTVKIHPYDASSQDLQDGQIVELGNQRGSVILHSEITDKVPQGTLVSEGLWPNSVFQNGNGINTLVGADQVAPHGGAAFHDIHVWIRAVN